jgi:hypothetical protein
VQQIADVCDSVHDLDCTKVLNRLQGCIGNVRGDNSINEHTAMYIESVLSRPYLFCHLFLMTVQMRAWVPVLLHLYCSVTPGTITDFEEMVLHICDYARANFSMDVDLLNRGKKGLPFLEHRYIYYTLGTDSMFRPAANSTDGLRQQIWSFLYHTVADMPPTRR